MTDIIDWQAGAILIAAIVGSLCAGYVFGFWSALQEQGGIEECGS